MKRFNLLMAMLVSVVLFAGCSATSNLTQNVNLTQTNVVLQDNNFRIVKNVSAEVSATYVFGIGGMSYKALRENAVANLTKEANLTGSQALINVTVESTTQFALIWTKTTFKAYGTVIEFM
ncbi:MAG: hypothetical protein E7146_00970 [Rikenellaceae bacterium]|nr:hypothetical protein [Rikenellaceae bacterium]